MSEHELEEVEELRHNVKIRGDVHPDLFNDLIKLPQSQRVTRLLSLALKGLLLSPSTVGGVGTQLRPPLEEPRRAGVGRTSKPLQASKKIPPAAEPRPTTPETSDVPVLGNVASTSTAAPAPNLEPQSSSSVLPLKEDKVAVVITPQPTITADTVSLGQALDLDSSDLDFLTDPGGALG